MADRIVVYKSHVYAEAEKWIRDHGRTDIDYEYQKECFLNGYVKAVSETWFDCEIIVEE